MSERSDTNRGTGNFDDAPTDCWARAGTITTPAIKTRIASRIERKQDMKIDVLYGIAVC